MALLELGSILSTMVAVMTLFTKLVTLIRAIQTLILHIEQMQEAIDTNKVSVGALRDTVTHLDLRTTKLEAKLEGGGQYGSVKTI